MRCHSIANDMVAVALLCVVLLQSLWVGGSGHPTPHLPSRCSTGGDDTLPPAASLVVISCNKHDHPQSYWDTMGAAVQRDVLGASAVPQPWQPRQTSGNADQRLDALVWLGDVVYADTPVLPGYWVATPIDGIRAKYVAQASNPHYQRFVSTNVAPRGRVYGVWDDHDFGMNDGGKEYKDKDAVQQLFLDFLGVPLVEADADARGGENTMHPRRAQAGVYSFEAIPFFSDRRGGAAADSNFPSEHYDAAVCLILLDVRYFRDDFTADRDGDMLGEQQWRWLDGILRDRVSDQGNSAGSANQAKQRKRKKCAVTLIGSGIQFLLDEKPTEHWGNFPNSRNRLLAMLKRHTVHRVVFLSGDVHLGEVGLDDSVDAIAALGYPMVELTSSGLTHSASSIPFVAERFLRMFPTPRRVGVFLGKNFGSVSLVMATCPSGGAGDVGHGGAAAPLRPAVRLRVHNLEKPASADDHSPPPSTTMVEFVVPLEALAPLDGSDADGLGADGDELHIVQYPDTPPGTVKHILMATQRYLLPKAKFHQLINLYVYGLLLVLVLAAALMARVVLGATCRWWQRTVGARGPQRNKKGQ